MSKKYKNKICVYCVDRVATTGDHVIARSLLLKSRRANLPKVPACLACNQAKSELEHYLSLILPFAGRHADARENLAAALPPRLAKNPSMQSVLQRAMVPSWILDPSGLIVRTYTLPLDADKLHQWCILVVRGLTWHHWRTLLPPDASFEIVIANPKADDIVGTLLTKRGRHRLDISLGEGTFAYQALQGADSPLVAVWRLHLYGGISLGGADPRIRSSEVGVLVAPRRVGEIADYWLKRQAASLVLAPTAHSLIVRPPTPRR